MTEAAGMTYTDLETAISRFTYWPGWTFTVYRDTWLGPMLYAVAIVPDRDDPATTTDLGLRSRIPPHALRSPADLGEWLLWRLTEAAIHECREGLRYDGELVDDPHQT